MDGERGVADARGKVKRSRRCKREEWRSTRRDEHLRPENYPFSTQDRSGLEVCAQNGRLYMLQLNISSPLWAIDIEDPRLPRVRNVTEKE